MQQAEQRRAARAAKPVAARARNRQPSGLTILLLADHEKTGSQMRLWEPVAWLAETQCGPANS